LQFAVVFAVIAITALSSVYLLTFREIEANTDRELTHELEQLEQAYEHGGIVELTSLVRKRDEYGTYLRHYYTLVNEHGELVAGNRELLKLWPLAPLDSVDVVYRESSQFMQSEENESNLRIAAKTLSDKFQVLVGQTQNAMVELREHTFIAVVSAVFLTVLLSVLAGIYMSRVVLSRITRIDEGLSDAIKADFKKYLPISKKEDEFHALTEKLNVMLARIESLITGMRHVTDNIAHDLRSPLTRLRSRLEVTLLQSRTEKEYQHAMEQAIEDCNELLTTFNALLSIAQAEAGVKRDNWQDVDLGVICDELADLYQAVAEDKGITFHWYKPRAIEIVGNRQLLAQAVSNLLENAIKYTPTGGDIWLDVEISDSHPMVKVCDNGPGIPTKDYERAVMRFQRLDSSRSTPGSGLGLSLVNAVAKLHEANLVLTDNKPGLCVALMFK